MRMARGIFVAGDFPLGGFFIRGILSRGIFHSGDFVAGDFPSGDFVGNPNEPDADYDGDGADYPLIYLDEEIDIKK